MKDLKFNIIVQMDKYDVMEAFSLAKVAAVTILDDLKPLYEAFCEGLADWRGRLVDEDGNGVTGPDSCMLHLRAGILIDPRTDESCDYETHFTFYMSFQSDDFVDWFLERAAEQFPNLVRD